MKKSLEQQVIESVRKRLNGSSSEDYDERDDESLVGVDHGTKYWVTVTADSPDAARDACKKLTDFRFSHDTQRGPVYAHNVDRNFDQSEFTFTVSARSAANAKKWVEDVLGAGVSVSVEE